MAFVLGFGCTEEKVRNEVKNALIGALVKGQDTKEVLKKWNDKADEYDKLPKETAPERYTRIFFYGGKLVFHHINRRHCMSPDGWALWSVEEQFGEQEEVKELDTLDLPL